jgi:hypothetical protein
MEPVGAGSTITVLCAKAAEQTVSVTTAVASMVLRIGQNSFFYPALMKNVPTGPLFRFGADVAPTLAKPPASV